MAELKGRRVDGAEHYFTLTRRRAGDYGYVTDEHGGRVLWIVDPVGNVGRLAQHDVTEHDDGTVTVEPSILDVGEHGFHGYLRRGVWSW